MASIITATTTSGLTQSADNSGVLQLASGTGNLVTVPSVTGTAMVSGNMPTFMAYTLTQQTLSHNVLTKITLDTEEYDTNNNFASSRFTPTVAGYYSFTVFVRFDANQTYTNMHLSVYKNGSLLYRGNEFSNSPGSINFPQGLQSTFLVYLNGTTDYAEFYMYQSNSVNGSISTGYTSTPFCNRAFGYLVRSA
jgi:hypothetical protein